MSEITEIFRALRKEEQRDKGGRREAATGSFEKARQLAIDFNMTLICKDRTLYQLRHKRRGWLLNIYPGNQRLYNPKNRQPRAPFLGRILDEMAAEHEFDETYNGWDLADVVWAAHRAEIVECF